jgi:hypothetical protein
MGGTVPYEEDQPAGSQQEEAPEATSDTKAGSSELTPATSAVIIGQATAVIAIASAIVYGAGGLSLGLRLWYDQYSVSAVLGQLPRDFLLLESISHVIPFALVLGILGYVSRPAAQSMWNRVNFGRGAATIYSLLIATAMGLVPLGFLEIVRRSTLHGVIRSYWQIFILCAIISFLFVRLAWYVLPRTNIQNLRRILGIGVLSLAAVPVVASASAAYAFPIVTVCGPAFSHVDQFGDHYAIGNLIGTSGQWLYVAETRAKSPSQGKYIFIGGYIAVIPVSSVKLEAIGKDASCGDLQSPITPAS